jgi:hypothetical protein
MISDLKSQNGTKKNASRNIRAMNDRDIESRLSDEQSPLPFARCDEIE